MRLLPYTVDMSGHKICGNCGEVMKEIQYQARSADEAQRTIFKCFNCPLDSSRLDFESMPSQPSSVWSSPRRKTSDVDGTPVKARYRFTRYVLQIPVPRSKQLTQGATAYECRRVTILGVRGSAGYTYRLPRTAEIMDVSPHNMGEGTCVVRYPAGQPGAWGTVEAMDEYFIPCHADSSESYVTGNYMRTENVGGRECFYVQKSGSDRISICCEIMDMEDDYWDAMRAFHSVGYLPATLYDVMDNTDVGRLSNLSPRAWDSPAPTTCEYIYTSKADGQRMWILVYGRICYYVSRLGKRQILGWWLCGGSAGKHGLPVVADVEFLAHGKSVLIDILIDSHGNTAPVSRDMRWVLESWHDLWSRVPDIPITMRKYFETVGEAKAYAVSEGYPCDGVVGIGMRTTEALKIKDIRSMELELKGNVLVSSDGDAVLSYDPQGRFADGDILEVRFSITNGRGKMLAHEVFERTDKTAANSTSVCKDIIVCALRDIQSPGDIQRRVAVTWCQELRGRIIDMAWGTKRDGNIVLDLGAGDGQSLDTLRTREHGAYILVEPDKDKCEKLARRAGVKRIHTDPMSLISVVQSLQKGSQQYAIIQCLAEQVVECAELMKHLRQRIRCATATFSAQFCISALDTCSDLGIPFIGCCYLYDGVKVGENLLDTSGVTMARTSSTLCSVKWGGDTVYTEPAVASKDFNGISRVSRASSIRRLPDAGADKEANTICSKIYVITSI